MASTTESANDYVLGRLVLDYFRAFLWPLVVAVVVLVYQEDVRQILSEREVDIFGLKIGDKVEQIESQALAEIADIRALVDAQQASTGNGANPEIAQDIETKLETLERNLSREIAQVQSAQQAQRIPPPGKTAPASAPVRSDRASLAAAAERRGFEALIEHDVTAAIAAFDEARKIWPDYHNVAEIGRALRKWEKRLSDPGNPAWAQFHREILTRYSWGLPADLRDAIRQAAAKAY